MKKNERKLTEKELKRKEQFEILLKTTFIRLNSVLSGRL